MLALGIALGFMLALSACDYTDEVVQVSAGGEHSCAVYEDGTVRCWGDNAYGQLGDRTAVDASTPVQVVGLTNAASVAAGTYHSCARLSDGTVACWGMGQLGQLGHGTNAPSLVPVPVAGLTGVTSVEAGSSHTCAGRNDGTVAC